MLNRIVTLHATGNRSIAQNFIGSIFGAFLRSVFNLVILQSIGKELRITVNLYFCLIKSDTICATNFIVSLISCKFSMLHLRTKSKYRFTQNFLKANHLAYIESRWYGSRISADCQQKLRFTKHDTSGRFLLVTFLEKQNREGMQRQLACLKMLSASK